MPLSIGDPSPSLKGATDWLSANEGSALHCNAPCLIHFWAMSCPSCKYNMPSLQALRDRYSPLGLSVVAVHMPRADDDAEIERVRQMAMELNMTEPCAIDNDHAIGDAFQMGGVWPTYFLFDSKNKLRCRAAGGFGVKMMERALTRMFPDAPELANPECPCGKSGAGGCCQDS